MIRYCSMWSLFWIGHGVSHLMNFWDWGFGGLYPVYSYCMLTAFDLQGEGKGPWRDVGSAEDSA